MMHKVLVLGAGMVAGPIVKYLLDHGIEVTLADNEKYKAENIIRKNGVGKAIELDAENDSSIEDQIKEHDLVVSLLPYAFHLKIARLCIKHKRNMVTTSYVKPEMLALDKEAKEAGVIILNEIGLDPGIDHMSAKKIIDEVHARGGAVKEFYSFCGALPAPEAIDNPFNYKFSWSPKGVIMASKNPAVYKRFGEIIEVPDPDIFKDLRWVEFPGIGKVEVYPNRDSLSYIDIYGIQESDTVIRGTIRFEGWSGILDALKTMDLLSYDEESVEGLTYAGFLARRAGLENGPDLPQKLAAKLGVSTDSKFIEALKFVGYFDDAPIRQKVISPFEITAELMIPKMMLKPEERDMILLMHTFKIRWENGSDEVVKSSMIDYGIPNGDTAISRTVALPAAIGVRMILENKISLKGVHIPVLPEIYEPVLQELEVLDIKMKDEFGLSDPGIIRKQ